MITLSSSLNESTLLDCFLPDPDEFSVILLLLPLDGAEDMSESLVLSMEFLDPSETGDIMRFEFAGDDDSSVSCDFNSVDVLHICYRLGTGQDVTTTQNQSHHSQT